MADDPKHITDQHWIPEVRPDGVHLVGEDGTSILKLCRPDAGSDMLIAGYITGLQAHVIHMRRSTK